MNNPEKPATLDTQDTALRQIKQKTQHRKLENMIISFFVIKIKAQAKIGIIMSTDMFSLS